MKKCLRYLAVGVWILWPVLPSSSALAQDRGEASSGSGRVLPVLGETAAVVVADAAAVAVAYGAARLAQAEPCDGSGDGGLSCAMSVFGAGIGAGSVVALFGGSLAAHLAGGMEGSYWSALAWGAVGLGGGLAAGMLVLTAADNGRAVVGTLIALPVVGHIAGTVAGYEASVPVDTETARVSWTPTFEPRAGGAVGGVRGSF